MRMYTQPTISPCGSPPRRWPVQSRPTVKWCQRRCKRLQTCRPADIQLLSRSATGWVNLCKLLKVYKEQNCWIQNAANFILTLASIGYKKVVLSIIWKNKGFFTPKMQVFSAFGVIFNFAVFNLLTSIHVPQAPPDCMWTNGILLYVAVCVCVHVCVCVRVRVCVCSWPDFTWHTGS